MKNGDNIGIPTPTSKIKYLHELISRILRYSIEIFTIKQSWLGKGRVKGKV